MEAWPMNRRDAINQIRQFGGRLDDDPRDSTDTQLPGEYDLFDLMAKVTEENLHALVDSGPPVGR
ncbi:hypothetical protein ONJ95_26925, partial [Salmonella enterica subsp. enterica serovar Virginia]|nr:hypothetical protein [Salmonella enterica subsp. enterica serovar Virginia]